MSGSGNAGPYKVRDSRLCKQHTPCPEGYVARSLWAEEMSNTHRQVRCEGCGRWEVWVEKKKPHRSEA